MEVWRGGCCLGLVRELWGGKEGGGGVVVRGGGKMEERKSVRTVPLLFVQKAYQSIGPIEL